jgi:hypothetical protein
MGVTRDMCFHAYDLLCASSTDMSPDLCICMNMSTYLYISVDVTH